MFQNEAMYMVAQKMILRQVLGSSQVKREKSSSGLGSFGTWQGYVQPMFNRGDDNKSISLFYLTRIPNRCVTMS